MRSSLRSFWSRLDSPVHPDDKEHFSKNLGKHTFDLRFPPPAFIGDVDNAPVVILMSNGGFRETTDNEFQDESDHVEYIEWLSGRRIEFPRRLSTYYTLNKIFPLIRNGQAVIVNAIAYRSPSLRAEPQNQKVGKFLPSAIAHRKWLSEELLPAAMRGNRLVIAHRFAAWGLRSKHPPIKANIHFSTNSISEELSNKTRTIIKEWLLKRTNYGT